MRPNRRDVQRAIRDVQELWKPPKETALALAGARAEGDNQIDSADDYTKDHRDGGRNDPRR